MSLYERDTILYPIDLDGELLVLVEDDGMGGVQLGAEPASGRYYQHADATLHSMTITDGGDTDAELRGLWHALIDILNNGTSAVGTRTGTPANTYAVSVVDPDDSPGYTNGGLEIRATQGGGADPFTLIFSGSPLTTIDPRWLGLKDEAHSTGVASTTDGDDEVIVLPNALMGRLVTQTLSPTGRASEKDRRPHHEIRRSNPVVRDSPRPLNWGSWHYRKMLYENVWAAFIGKRRANEAAYASIANIEQGDCNGAWEWLWDSLVFSDYVIVVHNSSDDLQVLTHSYEICKLESSPNWQNFARRTGNNGDLHRVEFELWVHPDFAGYDH